MANAGGIKEVSASPTAQFIIGSSLSHFAWQCLSLLSLITNSEIIASTCSENDQNCTLKISSWIHIHMFLRINTITGEF
jgi:hypothetical protein